MQCVAVQFVGGTGSDDEGVKAVVLRISSSAAALLLLTVRRVPAVAKGSTFTGTVLS